MTFDFTDRVMSMAAPGPKPRAQVHGYPVPEPATVPEVHGIREIELLKRHSKELNSEGDESAEYQSSWDVE
jgi:hypothetical protein